MRTRRKAGVSLRIPFVVLLAISHGSYFAPRHEWQHHTFWRTKPFSVLTYFIASQGALLLRKVILNFKYLSVQAKAS